MVMAATKEELDLAYYRSLMFFRANKHMLDADRERDAIEIIKCRGDHIGTPEAEMILGKLRSVGDRFL